LDADHPANGVLFARRSTALAQRSANASTEIKLLITTSRVQVNEGVALVESSGDALRKIVTEVSAVAELVDEIAEVAQKQSNGITEISSMVTRLDQFTQQNAAMVEQCSANTQSLSEEAIHLVDQLGRFQLSGRLGAGKVTYLPVSSHSIHRSANSSQHPTSFSGNSAVASRIHNR
jgi:methyl-accepting chemotaxis protein